MTKVSLIFDDGFAKSCLRTAEIFEARDLSASFAVLVDSSGIYPNTPKGDFDLWNRLQDRGHVIQPHGYDHSDLTKMTFNEAKIKIDSCLDYFAENLNDFKTKQSIYHLTYNRSTPQINNYLLNKVKAIRTTDINGEVGSGMNYETEIKNRIYNCSWFGPEYCDDHLMTILKQAEQQQPKIMMYMLHGLDNEGWGPINSHALEHNLDFIMESPWLDYIDSSAL